MVLLSSIMLKITSSSLSIRYINNHKQIFFLLLLLFYISFDWLRIGSFVQDVQLMPLEFSFSSTFWKGDFFLFVFCAASQNDHNCYWILYGSVWWTFKHWFNETLCHTSYIMQHITLYKDITYEWSWMNIKNK